MIVILTLYCCILTDCYLGDSLDRVDGLNCSRAILDAPRRCYDTNVKTKCCKSCQQISAVNPSCKYFIAFFM